MKGQYAHRSPDWERLAYESLAIAVIQRTALDYQKALIRLARHPDDEHAARTRDECEDFFFSPLFRVLADVNGYDLLLLLQDDAFSTLTKKRKRRVSA